MSHRVVWVLVSAVPLWLLGVAGGYLFLAYVLSFPNWAAAVCAFVGAMASGAGLAYGAIRAHGRLKATHESAGDATLGLNIPFVGPILLALGFVASVVGFALMWSEAGVIGGIVSSLGATAVVVGALVILRALRGLDEPAPRS